MFRSMLLSVFFVIVSQAVFSQHDTTNVCKLTEKAYMSLNSNIDSAYIYAKTAQRKTAAYPQSNLYNKAYLVLAIYHQVLNNQDSAEYLINKILSNAQSIDKILVVRAYLQLGTIKSHQGDINSSTDCFSKAYEGSLLVNNLNLNLFSRYQMVSTYYNIGRYQECIALVDEALRKIRKNKSVKPRLKTMFFGTLANVYNSIDVLKARPYFDSILAIAEELADSAIIYNAYNNLANNFYLSKNIEESIKYYKLVLKWFGKFNDNYNLAAVNINLGAAYLALEDIEIAKDYYISGLDFALLTTNYSYIRNAYQGLIEVYKDSDREKYYECYDSFLVYEKKLLKLSEEQNVSKINYYKDLAEERLLKANLEAESLEKDVLLWRRGLLLIITILTSVIVLIFWFRLKKQVKLNKIQSDLLQESNIELSILGRKKDQMLSILGHDLRGPLHNIIYLNNEVLNANLDENLHKKMLRDITVKTQNTADMIEGLLLWANKFLSSGIKIAKFSSAEKIDQVIEQLQFNINKKHLELERQIEDITLLSDPQTFQIVLRNLLSNAIKYTPTNHCIKIMAFLEQDYYKLIIIDQGTGFSQDALESINSENNYKINSTKGTAGEKGSGVGLKLSLEFAQMIGGTIKVLKTDGSGTEIEFSLKTKS